MIDIRHLVPESLDPFREVIAETFEYYLNRTSAMNGPQAGGNIDSLIALALDRPALHKLAQVLSRNRSLPLDLRLSLQTLESYPPRTAFPDICDVIRQELGDDLHQLDLGEAALAEASVAVVVPFHWRASRQDLPARGVLKVLKPGVRDRLEAELAVWYDVGHFFAESCRQSKLPEINWRETFETVANLLRNEIDFAAEQRNIETASEALSRLDGVHVPRLLPFCSPRITAMERIDGVKVTNTDALTPATRRNLARCIVEALIAQPMWSSKECSMFHADPHAGNLMATSGGELAILDWAMVGTLSEEDRRRFAQLILNAQLLDRRGLCRTIECLCHGHTLDQSVLERVVERMLCRRPAPLGPMFSWVTALLDAAVLECGARFSDDLLLFRKSLLVLDGVVADLIGDGGLDRLLFSSAVTQLVREWPARVLLPPASRELGSRLSNLDLLRAGWMLPWVATSPWFVETGRK